MGRDYSELEAQIQAKMRDSFIVAARERLDFTLAAYDRFTSERGGSGSDVKGDTRSQGNGRFFRVSLDHLDRGAGRTGPEITDLG